MGDFDDYVQQAEQLSSIMCGPSKLDKRFLKGLWDASEGGDPSARVERAVNQVMAALEKGEAVAADGSTGGDGGGGGSKGGGGSGGTGGGAGTAKKKEKEKKHKKEKNRASDSFESTGFGFSDGTSFAAPPSALDPAAVGCFGDAGGMGMAGMGMPGGMSQMQQQMPPHVPPAHIPPTMQPPMPPQQAGWGDMPPQMAQQMPSMPPPMMTQMPPPPIHPPGQLGQQMQNTQNELAELQKQIDELQRSTQPSMISTGFPAAGNDGALMGSNSGGLMGGGSPAFGDDESESDSDNDWWHVPPPPGGMMHSVSGYGGGGMGPLQNTASFGSMAPPAGGANQFWGSM